jgi:methyl-accepting chemotaxis protein
VSTARLMSGRELLRQLVKLNSLLSVPAVTIVVLCLVALLRLTAAQWVFFAGCALIYGVVITPLSMWIQHRLVAPVIEWLDARAAGTASAAQREAAFRIVMATPYRQGIQAAVSWLLPVALVALAMAIRYEGWGVYENAVMVVAGVAAGFSVGIFAGFFAKWRVGEIREVLAFEIGEPAERLRLFHRISLRTRLVCAITGVTLVPVVFAVMLSFERTQHSLESFTADWQQRILDTIHDSSEPAMANAREWLDQVPLPAPISLGLLDEVGLGEEVTDHIRSAIASGAREGHSGTLPSSLVFAWRHVEDGRTVVAATPSAELQVHGARSVVIFGGLLVASIALSLAVAWLLAQDVSRAAGVLRGEAERLAGGDLRRGRVFESEDELGDLARAFETMALSLRTTVSRVAEAADRVEATAGELAPVSESVASVTADQVAGIERAASSMEEINAQVRGIARSSSALNESVEESSSSVLELGASGEELNETASLLSSKVEEVSSSIEQMVRSVKAVLSNTESLYVASEETSASMDEMASSLRAVDVSAQEMSKRSERVVERAESGQSKVRETIAGMEAIRDSTETAERVIRALHGRTEEIGAIVDVIDDVADETNLLALNAAIIAAQAGEHGRAFSVVADEIKDLAERVLASTKEIGGLIGSVQEEATNAIAAVERGAANVASGVDLSAEAGMALEEITEASRDSGTRIAGIVSALREQAKAAVHVAELMERVQSGVHEIRQAASEQDRGNVVVYQGSVTMREVAAQVRGTTEEQARGSGRIRESVEGVREAVEQINAALQEQTQACAAAVEILEGVSGRTQKNEESAAAMDAVTKGLLHQAETLRGEVRRFRV